MGRALGVDLKVWKKSEEGQLSQMEAVRWNTVRGSLSLQEQSST